MRRLIGVVAIAFLGVFSASAQQAQSPSTNIPAASLDLKSVDGLVYSVARPFPFLSASGNFEIRLPIQTTHAPLTNIEVGIGNAVLRDSKEAVNARISPRIGKPEGGYLPISVAISDLAASGVLEFPIRMTGDTLPPDQSFSVIVNARDGPVAPLLVIFFGVAVSAAVNYIAQQYKPVQLLLVRLLPLKAQLLNWKIVTRAGARRSQLERLLMRLNVVENRSDGSDFAALSSELAEVESESNGIARERAQQADSIRDRVEQIRTKLMTYGNQGPALTETEREEFTTLEERCRRAENLIINEIFDDAEEEIRSTEDEVCDLRKRRAERLFEHLKRRSNELPADIKVTFDQTAAGFRPALNESIENAEAKLGELQLLISRHLDVSEVDRPAGRAQTGGRLIVDPIRPAAGSPVVFSIPVEEQSEEPHPRVLWNFGDGVEQPTNTVRETHTFTYPSRFSVRATLGPDSVTYTAEIIVAHRLIDSSLEVKAARDRARRADFILIVISVAAATGSGILALYVGKVFGTLGDYITACLWGIGIDSSVRTFRDAYGKLRSG